MVIETKILLVIFILHLDGRACALFYLLHSVLVPRTKDVKQVENKKITKKFSISDSRRSFILLGSSVADCEAELQLLQSNKEKIQPLILI